MSSLSVPGIENLKVMITDDDDEERDVGEHIETEHCLYFLPATNRAL